MDETHKYDDIIDLPRPVSRRHAPMSRLNRAAQFSPFAALTGYDALVQETARLTEDEIVLGEDARAELDEALTRLQERIEERPEVTITFFEPDPRKRGGSYKQLKTILKKIDTIEAQIVLLDGERIAIGNILRISLPEEWENQ